MFSSMQSRPPLQKMLLQVDLCSIILTYKKGVAHIFRESEGCGHEYFYRASPLDALIFSPP